MVIGGITILLGVLSGSTATPAGRRWFQRLKRPRWLTFEALIPVIWTVVFTCGAWSAYMIWEQEPGSSKTWIYMGCYLLLESVTLSYNTLMLWVRRLRVGTAVGATGLMIAALLAIAIWQVSNRAALLLLPYLLWSPIGTYTTWKMMQLNPLDA
jgi:translocator protein